MIMEEIKTAFMIIGIAVTTGFFSWIIFNMIVLWKHKPKSEEQCPEWADKNKWERSKI